MSDNLNKERVMSGLFDFLDFKTKNWREVEVRAFSAEECDAIQSVEVVAGEYSKRACFTIYVNGVTKTAFKSIEPIADVKVGDKLDPHDLSFVFLEYIGSDPNQKKTKDIKIRVNPPTAKEEVDFNNPFGL